MTMENIFVVGLVNGEVNITEEVVLSHSTDQVVTVSSILNPELSLDSITAGSMLLDSTSKVLALSRQEAQQVKAYFEANAVGITEAPKTIDFKLLGSVLSNKNLRSKMVHDLNTALVEYIFSPENSELKGLVDISMVFDLKNNRINHYVEVLSEGDISQILKQERYENPTLFDSRTLAINILVANPLDFRGTQATKPLYEMYLLALLSKSVSFIQSQLSLEFVQR